MPQHNNISFNHAQPFEVLSKVPTPIIQYKINTIKKLNLGNASIENIIPLFDDLLKYQLRILTGVYYPWYYRARITNEKNLSELMHLQPEKVVKYGRCNNLHESIFYCSNCYTTSILEVKPNVDDIVTVLILDLSDDKNDITRHLPILPLAKDSLNDDLLSAFITSENRLINERLTLINKFYSDIMLQIVNEGEEHKYKLSIALVNAIKKRYPKYPCAIAFPSKASKHFGVNFAIAAKWIESLDKPQYKAFRIKIKSVNNSFDAIGHIIEVAQEMDDNNNFIFKDVSHINRILPLNSTFYNQYEELFKLQKKKLKSNDGFFRRYYPPPLFPAPYNLIEEQSYFTLEDLKQINSNDYEFTIRPYELEYDGMIGDSDISKHDNPWN